MSTFWIYLPPVVLVGSIIALIIYLGGKTKRIGRDKLFAKSEYSKSANLTGESKIKKFGSVVLHFLEKALVLAKIFVKKSELSISELVAKLRARRFGKKDMENYSSDKREAEELDSLKETEKGVNILRKFKKEEYNFGEDISQSQGTSWIRSDTSREKNELPKTEERISKEVSAEDKAREEALIHRIAENPKDIEAYRELGDYYLKIGNVKDSKDSFKMVLKLRPRDLKAKSSLREIEMKMRLGS